MKIIFILLCLVLLSGIFFRRYEILEKGFSSFPFFNKRKKSFHVFQHQDNPGEITAQEMIPLPEKVMSRHALKASTLLKKADNALNKGDLETAEKLTIQSIALDPSLREAYSKLGLLYLSQEQFSKAEMIFRRLILGEIPEAVHFSNLGLSLYHQNKLAEAKTFYEKAIELDSSRPGRFFSLAKISHELHEFPVALEYFKKAIAMDPKNFDYLLTLVEFYREQQMLPEAQQFVADMAIAFPGDEKISALMRSLEKEQGA